MGWKGWLLIGAVAYFVFKTKHPRWYEDLMLRAYAPDHVVPKAQTPEEQAKYAQASQAATAVGLPIGWIIEIAGKVKAEDLAMIAKRLSEAVLVMGMPSDTLPNTLATYKAKAYAHAGVPA